ncbi:UNKNOWN [Stylonychia lemnae]|uniref:Ubiquitin-like protease family profile domain-containing protein n=1 Tax=Stylonychia lemnae TaxID=5949 RepID=A0A078B0H9_STYLE|nr:UNKNOWN [Stylonychia lemnae]|eukprot:CDW86608.1 UNKNOWN [Stylonychia lemnae]
MILRKIKPLRQQKQIKAKNKQKKKKDRRLEKRKSNSKEKQPQQIENSTKKKNKSESDSIKPSVNIDLQSSQSLERNKNKKSEDTKNKTQQKIESTQQAKIKKIKEKKPINNQESEQVIPNQRQISNNTQTINDQKHKSSSTSLMRIEKTLSPLKTRSQQLQTQVESYNENSKLKSQNDQLKQNQSIKLDKQVIKNKAQNQKITQQVDSVLDQNQLDNNNNTQPQVTTRQTRLQSNQHNQTKECLTQKGIDKKKEVKNKDLPNKTSDISKNSKNIKKEKQESTKEIIKNKEPKSIKDNKIKEKKKTCGIKNQNNLEQNNKDSIANESPFQRETRARRQWKEEQIKQIKQEEFKQIKPQVEPAIELDHILGRNLQLSSIQIDELEESKYNNNLLNYQEKMIFEEQELSSLSYLPNQEEQIEQYEILIGSQPSQNQLELELQSMNQMIKCQKIQPSLDSHQHSENQEMKDEEVLVLNQQKIELIEQLNQSQKDEDEKMEICFQYEDDIPVSVPLVIQTQRTENNNMFTISDTSLDNIPIDNQEQNNASIEIGDQEMIDPTLPENIQQMIQRYSSNQDSSNSDNDHIRKIEIYQQEIDDHDYQTLQEGKYLNDNIINFFMTFLYNTIIAAEQREKIKILTTFQYHLWSRKIDEGNIDGLLKMLSKLKLTEKIQYLIIPIHRLEEQHWALAVLSNVNKGFPSEDDHDLLNIPCIIYMDSLMTINKKIQKNLDKVLRLILEQGMKRDLEKSIQNSQMNNVNEQPQELSQLQGSEKKISERLKYLSFRMNIPQQQNGYDCGMYLLEYAERFMINPEGNFLDNRNVILYQQRDWLEQKAQHINRQIEKAILEHSWLQEKEKIVKYINEKCSQTSQRLHELLHILYNKNIQFEEEYPDIYKDVEKRVQSCPQNTQLFDNKLMLTKRQDFKTILHNLQRANINDENAIQEIATQYIIARKLDQTSWLMQSLE